MTFQRSIASGIEMRLVEAADSIPFFALVERNRAYLREWLLWVDRTNSPEDLLDFIENRVKPQFEANNGPHCVILVEGEIAGNIGCHEIDWVNRSVSLGYWLDAAHQGQGIITKCCAAMLDYLFDELLLHRVLIECGTGNIRSCAIPQRLGFTREGVKREGQCVGGRWIDLVMWGILDREWRAWQGVRR